MCGIAGYLLSTGAPPDEALLRAMAARIAHRGPDGEGFYRDGPVGFAHRRLAIIDLSDGGAQPLVDGDVAVTYNGEIYNYRELRAELAQLGHVFRTLSDTEVLLRAYREWGAECVGRLRGMWAFALWDRARGELFCARDPFGIKPFYYAAAGGDFRFGSEPAALLAAGVRARADLGTVACFVALGLSDHGERTFFEGIAALPPGGRLVVSADGRVRPLGRFDPLAAERPASTVEEFETTVRGSVALHLRSDVPVGGCLSGGLDSSVVNALAAPIVRAASGRGFQAITAGADDTAIDERPFARAVAEYCGLEWASICPSGEQFLADLGDCLSAQGEPVLSPSVYLQFVVMRKARELGLKVMLDGQGADELLCGYERYIGPLFGALRRRRGLAYATREALGYARRTRGGTLAALAVSAYFASPALRQAVVRRRLDWLDQPLRAPVRAVVAEIATSYGSLRDARLEELRRFSLPALLRFEDRNSMWHGVEARVPYVDTEVARCALALPADTLVAGGYSKFALRQVAAHVLPASIAWRRFKIGFEPPVARWMAGMQQEVSTSIGASDVVRAVGDAAHPAAAATGDMRWRLYCVARWEKANGVAV
jgi:asparagine synthase (glutamine-hydrolysing)